MIDSILDVVHDVMSSPWIYLAIFALSAIDGFFPAVPSESVVITAGVFAASSSEPDLLFIIATAAVGAFVGDHISYTIGRVAGGRMLTRMRPGTKRRAVYDWAAKTLHDRGGLILVIARYIPGGRTAITLTMGAMRYPLRVFSFFDAIAAISWANYGALIGYLGGKAFEDDPIKGLILGLGIAIGVTVLVELIRHFRQRARRRREAAVSTPDDGPAPDTAVAADATPPVLERLEPHEPHEPHPTEAPGTRPVP